MEPAESLSAALAALTFADLTIDETTGRIVDAVAQWGTGQGWRVYRRAPSVVTLPPPMDRQHSVLDVACARPDGPPLAIEVDHTNRRRTVDKLLAEARAGRVPIWVRWGTGGFSPPPAPVAMVTVEVTRRGKLNSRGHQRPAPTHSPVLGGVAAGAPEEITFPLDPPPEPG
ncbi:hypothetical protein [Mangrovihabitans endophyticus]|uniref:Uncharacterized protein n=1 Tax=Mangrovihabitans endophyticus TaxID=1751298 RepID=A0A8J3C1B1_9ACTN|nr:hypothetical protein [Mangrovihabitans endophyticus]GGL00749.1 hypothetical protein GCM10012284_39120 [Mangrovihabitans endophyticus]